MARRPRPAAKRTRWTTLPPAPPAVLVGRADELRLLRGRLRRLPVALIYGVGGVGKSAVAYALAGRWPHRVVYRRFSEGDPAARIVDDLRRTLHAGAVADEPDEARALEALAAAADERAALLLVDDLHLLPADAAERFVAAFGSLRRARLIATSRERLSRAGAPDRVELQLEPLARADAATLWRALDRLYGRSHGFDAAYAASAGNPLVLRRWHAGEHAGDDPVADLFERLSPAERRVAALLSLTTLRVPAAPLQTALGAGARRAISSLVRKLIVDADAGGLSVHDLVRAALLRTLTPRRRAELARQLAGIVARLDHDPVVRAREVVRLLCAAGAWRPAGDHLLAVAPELIRLGAARDLLAAYDAIPAPRRSRAVAIGRARTLARASSLRDAYHALSRLADAGAADVELELVLAQVAMLVGELAAAHGSVERALAQPLSPAQLVRAQTTRALILTHLDRGDEARAFLAAAEAESPHAKHRAHLALTRAFTLWLDEEVAAGDAHALIARARLLYGDAADDAYQARALALPLVSAVLGRQGREADARDALDVAARLMAGRSDALLTLEVEFLRAALQVELGARCDALVRFTAIEQAFAARGNVLGERLAQVWRARVLHLLGRVAEARALLDDVAARSPSLPGVLRAVERSRRYDPSLQLGAAGAGAVPAALALRHELFAALAAAAAGDEAAVRLHLSSAAQRSRGPGYALDRALACLARARLAVARGKRAAAAAERRRADAEAGGEVDAGLIAGLAAGAGIVADDARDPVVLDLRAAKLRWSSGAVAIGSRPALQRLLVVLSERRAVEKSALAAALWGAVYKPSTHDNALWVNIMRLRKLIAAAGLTVETTADGYRLMAPSGIVIVGRE